MLYGDVHDFDFSLPLMALMRLHQKAAAPLLEDARKTRTAPPSLGAVQRCIHLILSTTKRTPATFKRMVNAFLTTGSDISPKESLDRAAEDFSLMLVEREAKYVER